MIDVVSFVNCTRLHHASIHKLFPIVCVILEYLSIYYIIVYCGTEFGIIGTASFK